ncbi:unnamed protein product, partial [Cylicostephanus goldi]
STFPSGGRYAGHWLGDNTATWEDLQSAVIGAQEFNMFVPYWALQKETLTQKSIKKTTSRYIGSDICGFNGETTEELCLRWQQMGAFHTFMRNHNAIGLPPQDPFMWRTVTNATIKANLFRYEYLPYLYSLHFEASMYGKTVIRPVFYEYPTDARTHNLGDEFLWGSSMLIAPGAQSVQAYLPKDDWFSVFDYKYGQRVWDGEQIFPAPYDSLIPADLSFLAKSPTSPQSTLGEMRSSRSPDIADGFLYWDDGESIVESFATHPYYHWTFNYKQSEFGASLTIKMEHEANDLKVPTLDTVEIFNYKYPINMEKQTFTLNGNEVSK